MKEKILVLVRATPEESKRGHRVCVAGLTENNEWRRLYPFEFKYGRKHLDFRKKDTIEVNVAPSEHDNRKESRKVLSHKNFFSPLEDEEIVKRLNTLICTIDDMKSSSASLCVVKPVIKDVIIDIKSTNVPDSQMYLSHMGLGTREKVKIPVEISYVFKCGGACCSQKSHKIIIIDWEINELARNVLRRDQDKHIAENKIRKKLFDWMKTRDVYFILGTHFKFKTPLIIGIFYPKKQ